MSLIRSIRLKKIHLPLKRPYEIQYKITESVSMWIVEIRTQNHSGYGCASPEPEVTKETFEDCGKALSPFSQKLKGCQVGTHLPHEVSESLKKTPAACAAFDMALYDLLAQEEDQPLIHYLGIRSEPVPTSVTVGISSIEQTLSESLDLLNKGFTILKIKTGHELKEDLLRLTTLRKHLGPDIRIRVDGNQGYSEEELLEFYKASKNLHLNLEFIEQPVPPKDLNSLIQKHPLISSKIMADESVLNLSDLKKLHVDCKLINIKLMKCGGITHALAMADFAQKQNISIMWGCMDESVISISAALATAYACSATQFLDLDGSLDLAEDVASGGFEIHPKGILKPNSKPGLGVKVKNIFE